VSHLTPTISNKHSLFFQSLGCAKNLVDTEVMLGITKNDGMTIVSRPEDASVIVINTCSFINDSKKESIDAILEAGQYKKKGRCERLIVAGCLPQRYLADLKVSFPEVDAFVGTGQYAQILDFISGEKEQQLNFRHPKYIHSENTPRINSQPSHRAYLKLAEGCMKHCSFCIIPKIRGNLRSRSIPSLIKEAHTLVEGGAVELNLIAQDLSDYGKDLANGTDLLGLLKALVKIEKLKWIRMFYLYPDELSDTFLEFVAGETKICNYIDMPLQHISNRMLRLMNRKVTADQIWKRIKKIRSLVPDVSFRTTVIVGYPSETEAEFQQLCDFVKKARFDHLGAFSYSHEEGTASYYAPKQLDEEIKLERRNKLMALQHQISAKTLQSKVGKTLNVLLEAPLDPAGTQWRGRHQGQAPDVDGQVIISGAPFKPGVFVPIKIDHTNAYDLMGSPVTCS